MEIPPNLKWSIRQARSVEGNDTQLQYAKAHNLVDKDGFVRSSKYIKQGDVHWGYTSAWLAAIGDGLGKRADTLDQVHNVTKNAKRENASWGRRVFKKTVAFVVDAYEYFALSFRASHWHKKAVDAARQATLQNQ